MSFLSQEKPAGQIGSMNTNEVRYMNIAKALGIIAVVIGHSGSPLKPYVYQYHLALFYFISGYFFRDTYVTAPLSFIKKRLKTLYLPYISYQIPFLMFHNILVHYFIYSYQFDQLYTWADFFFNGLKVLLFFGDSERLPSMLWFLCSLFFVNIIFCIIRLAGTRLQRSDLFTLIAVLAIFFFGMAARYRSTYPEQILNVVYVSLIIYYAGYQYRRIEHRIPFHWGIALIAGAVLIVNAHRGQIDFAANQFGTIDIFATSSLLGIYANIFIAKRLAAKGNRSLEYIGKSTIAIMALHPLAFKVISLIQIYYYSYPLERLASFPVLNGAYAWWIAYSLSGLLLPLVVKYLFQLSADLLRLRT